MKSEKPIKLVLIEMLCGLLVMFAIGFAAIHSASAPGLLLASAAHADSIERQRNAEIAYCMDETNQRTSRAVKPALDRMYECLQINGWLPGSGNPKMLPRDYVDRVDRAFAKEDRRR
jgi:hypothetical protein